MTQSTNYDSGILSALTDFKVASFATPRLIRFMYVLGFGLIALFTLIFLVTSLLSGGFEAFIALIAVPLIGLLYLIFFRVYVEVVSLLFRIGQDISVISSSVSSEGPSSPGGRPPFSDGGPTGGPSSPPPPAG